MQRIFCCCCCWTRFCSLNFYAHSNQMAALHWERKALNNQPPSSFFFVQSIIVAKFLRFLSLQLLFNCWLILHSSCRLMLKYDFVSFSIFLSFFSLLLFSISRSMRIIYAEFTCTFFFACRWLKISSTPIKRSTFRRRISSCQTQRDDKIRAMSWSTTFVRDDFFICWNLENDVAMIESWITVTIRGIIDAINL